MLFRYGVNAKQAQMWLGHHSPAFTLATYVHLLPDDLPDPGFLDRLTGSGWSGSEDLEDSHVRDHAKVEDEALPASALR
jgi:hypothetical protein